MARACKSRCFATHAFDIELSNVARNPYFVYNPAFDTGVYIKSLYDFNLQFPGNIIEARHLKRLHLVYLSMETVRSHIEETKNAIKSILETDKELAKLTLSELDEILKTKFTLMDKVVKWEDHNKESNRVKERYIDLLMNEMDKLNAILHWKQLSDWRIKIDIKQYKRHVIEYINNSDVPDNYLKRYVGVDTFDMAWKLIASGDIVLNPMDIRELDLRFIKYVMKKRKYKNPFQLMQLPKKKDNECNEYNEDHGIIDYDDYGIVTKTYMMPAERFWVNVLASGRDDICRDDVMVCIGVDVDQRLRFMPQAVTVFEEGDLLPQIISHYKGAGISPMIKWRRNVGILLGNDPCQFHDYYEFMEKAPFIANMFSIELPYMCYAFVDRVEVDVIGPDWDFVTQTMKKDDGKQKEHINVGYEYILDKFRPIDKKQSISTYSTTRTISRKCKENHSPTYYITWRFGLMSAFHTVAAIRVYGKAISLV